MKSGRLRAGRHAHVIRSPMLVRVLADAEIMHDEGEGVARDYQKVNGTSEDATMRRLRDLCEKGIGERGPGGAGSPPSFSVVPALETDARFLETRIPRLREYFSRKPALQNSDYRVLFEVDRHNTLRELRRLATLGVLMARGTGRGTHYELATRRE